MSDETVFSSSKRKSPVKNIKTLTVFIFFVTLQRITSSPQESLFYRSSNFTCYFSLGLMFILPHYLSHFLHAWNYNMTLTWAVNKDLF